MTDNARLFRNFVFSITLLFVVIAIDVNNVFSRIVPAPEPELEEVVVPERTPTVPVVPVELLPPEPEIDYEAITCLATNIYHEARGESAQGQVAVAHVTFNRMKSRRFPNTICDVVYQAVYSTWWYESHGRLVPVRYKCQFTWFCDGKSDRINTESTSWKNAKRIAWEVMYNGLPDPTNGSTHYFNHHLVNPYWANHMTYVATIQNHSFYIH